MYPTNPRMGTQSHAELALFAALRSKLPDHYLVFHAVKWVLRDPEGGAREGEADFIICHPERGLLVLEVKGGRIRIDGATDQWYSNEHEIRDPFAQAAGNKYSLLRKMKELPYWRNRTIAIGHCVALPDVAVKQDLRLDAPEEITLDGEDVGDLRRRIEEMMAYWFGDSTGAGVGAAGAQQLISLFAPSRELRPHMALEFAGEAQTMLQLTEEQFMLLDLLRGRPRVAVRGCAGAGKTTLAVEQARRLAAQGFRVLLTCFNKNLAAFLRRSVKFEEPVDVIHFHSVCNSLAHKAGLRPPGRGPPRS
ncbi:MAG: NERD domain-containing protein [Anaerolineales bacterium]|nr:NERD domain-containing protein [Anaerolineales bacterium]